MTNAPPNRFLWLYDRITETEMSGMQIAVMFVLLARDEAGLRAITKSEIGALVGVSDRQVTTVLTQLERDLSLIQTQRHGGTGKGRVANSYLVRPDANGSEIPVAWGNKKSSSGMPLPVTESNQQPSSGSELPLAGNVPEISGSQGGSVLPVACGEILPPLEHAPARGEANLKLRDTSQLYPERVELVVSSSAPKVLNGSAKGMSTQALAAFIVEHVNSPWLDPHKTLSLNTSHARIHVWMRDLDADFDQDILPTIERKMTLPRTVPVRTWGYFDEAVRETVIARRRAEGPMKNITPEEIETHDQQRTGRSDNGASYGRAKRNHHTDLLLRDVLDDPASVVGGLDFSPNK